MNDPKILNIEIRDEISNFISSEKSSRNKSTFAEQVGISRTTLNNFLNGELDSSPKTVFKILKFFRGHQEAEKLIQDFYPTWYCYGGKKYIDGQTVSSNDHDFNFNAIHKKILDKSELSGGVTETWVQEKFGSEIGIPALMDLLKSGFITLQNGIYKMPAIVNDDNPRRIIEQIKAECEIFPLDEYLKTSFALKYDFLVCSSVRTIAVKAISECFEKIDNAQQNPEFANEPKNELLKISLLGNWMKDEGEKNV